MTIAKVKNVLTREKKLILAFSVLFCLTFYLNYLYPLFADDWAYSFTHLGKRVNSFHDILITQYDHYFSWGGRSVVHIIAQTLLWMNETLADLLNSIIYILLILAMYSISNKGNKQSSVPLFLVICLFMWFLQGNFPDTVLWITGSANYLWGCLIILIFLYPYLSYYHKPVHDSVNIKSCFIFIGGILAGWTNENMALALIFFICVLFVLLKKEKQKIPFWAIAGLISVCLGTFFLLAAPGNYIRYDVMTQDTTVDYLYYTKKIKGMIRLFVRFGLLPTLIYAILVFISYKQDLHKTKPKAFRLSLLFYASSIIAIVVMIAAPSFPPRAWFGIITFAIIAISILYANLDLSSSLLRILNASGLILTTLLFCVSFGLGARELHKIHNIFEKREIEISKQKEQGYENIILYGKFETNKNILLTIPKIVDLPKDYSDWRYEAYAKYHGVKSIVILNDSLIQEKSSK